MKNVPIIFKFFAIMGIFGAFVIAVSIYATSQMRDIDNNYSALMAGNAEGTIDLARANRGFQEARDGIAEMQIADTDAQNAAAKAIHDDGEKVFLTEMDNAASLVPAHAQDIASLKAQGQNVLDNVCAKAITLGLAATTPAQALASQAEFMNNCSPQFPPVATALNNEVKAIDAETANDDNAQSASTDNTIMITYAAILGGLAIVLAIGFFAIRAWVVTPIKALQTVMGRLAGGDLKTNVNGADRKDEVGGMARAVEVFKQAGLDKLKAEEEAAANRAQAETLRKQSEAERAEAAAQAKRVVTDVATGLEKLAAGDLLFRLSQPFQADYEKLRTDFNGAMEKMQATMKSIAASASGVHAGSGEISASSDDLSKRTEQQAASLEQTAAALDEITAAVKKTAEGANEARDAVTSAKSEAESSAKIVGETVDAMNGIETSSKQIGNIIGVIDEIAFQTNLLALNAGVEAARAGDAGRGFAVVATEVRALAQRSAEAAKEIKTLISASGEQVESGVKLVGETGRALNRIVTQVGTLNQLVTAIAASAKEQATGLDQVNTAVNQMDQVTQQNAAMVEQATAASKSLASEAEELSNLVAQFSIGQTRGTPTRPAAAPKPARSTHATVEKIAALSRQAVAAGGTADSSKDWSEF